MRSGTMTRSSFLSRYRLTHGRRTVAMPRTNYPTRGSFVICGAWTFQLMRSARSYGRATTQERLNRSSSGTGCAFARRADALDKMMATSEAFTDQGVPVPPPNGVRVVQVMLAYRDHEESVRFYTDVFGLEFHHDISSFVLGA